MLPPRIGLGYDVVVASIPTPILSTTREFLFVVGGVQTDFPAKQSPKPIDEMVAPNMLEAKNIIVMTMLLIYQVILLLRVQQTLSLYIFIN
jgi:hypothetical protein